MRHTLIISENTLRGHNDAARAITGSAMGATASGPRQIGSSSSAAPAAEAVLALAEAKR